MLLEHAFLLYYRHSCLPTHRQQFYYTLQYLRTSYFVPSTSVLCLLARDRLRWVSYVLSTTFTYTYLAQNQAILSYRWIDQVLCLLACDRLRTGRSYHTDKSPHTCSQSVLVTAKMATRLWWLLELLDAQVELCRDKQEMKGKLSEVYALGGTHARL